MRPSIIFPNPSHFGSRDLGLTNLLLTNMYAQVTPYQGDWKADWLLSDINSNTWEIGKSRTKSGAWATTFNINWDVLLPDGSLFTAPEHSLPLSTSKKSVFLLMHATYKNTSNIPQYVKTLLTLVRFLYDREDIYNPDKYAFSKLDATAVNEYMSLLVSGGISGVLDIVEKCRSLFYRKAFDQSPPNSMELSNDEFYGIYNFLRDNGFFKTRTNSYFPCEYIDRTKLGKSINVDPRSMNSVSVSLFLRTFEVEYDVIFPSILAPILFETEYCSNRTLTKKEAKSFIASETTCNCHLDMIQQLQRIGMHLPDSMPHSIDFQPARKILQQAAPIKGTPWAPINTALRYTNEALKLLVTHGEALAGFYIKSIDHFSKINLFNISGDSHIVTLNKRIRRDSWVNDNLPTSLRPLNINGWTTAFDAVQDECPYVEFHRAPSLSDMVSVLTGAIAMLIGTTKPLREEELRSLRRNCVDFVDGDGYWLTQYAGKAGARNFRPVIRRPIPAITARAIEIVARISSTLAKVSGTTQEHQLDSLFYLLPSKISRLRPSVINRGSLYDRINLFCDYVNMDPDQDGRRWYIRIHELRKSFLISFFWLFRHNALDAARWMAGHADTDHIYTYIQGNFPGDELPALEAEYVNHLMWDFESRVTVTDRVRNIEEVHQDVCSNFGVTRISLIPERELQAWLEACFRTGVYSSQVYTIGSDAANLSVEIAFKLSKAA